MIAPGVNHNTESNEVGHDSHSNCDKNRNSNTSMMHASTCIDRKREIYGILNIRPFDDMARRGT